MTLRFAVFFLFVCSAFSADVSAKASNAEKKQEEQKKKVEQLKKRAKFAELSLEQDTEQAKSTTSKVTNNSSKSKDANGEVERFVMPFTKWVEGKLHNSPVVNPTKEQISKKSKQKSNGLGLREAIKKALLVFPGTVLSAEKATVGEASVYKIKIISKSGVVKIVTIANGEGNSARK